MVYQNEQGIRRLVVELPVDVHTRFKTEVSRLGLDLRGVIIRLIESWLSGNSKIKIQPAVRNPEESLEEIIERVIDKKFGQIDIETETVAEPVDVHNVEEPIEVEEPEEIPEENKEPAVAEKSGDSRPRKKKMAGLWPYVKEVDVEEKKPDDQKPRKKRGLWPWVR
ncbi:hypothetical protein ES705_31886 [subsurface metagenome]